VGFIPAFGLQPKSHFRVNELTGRHPKREDEMKQPSQGPIYGELHSMSFIQLFHLCVAIASWKWARNRDLSLVVGRAQECDRKRRLQPAYAAVLLHEGRNVRAERITSAGERASSCCTAW
jgi:hypothetical protein